MAMETGAAMARLLADAYLMYAHAHIAHWNITGPDFPDKHRFLNDVYDDVYDSVDDIAERMRAIGAFVSPTFTGVLSFASIADSPVPRDWQGIRAMLVRDNDAVIASLGAAFASTDSQGLKNYLADRLDRHAKWGWMLRASA